MRCWVTTMLHQRWALNQTFSLKVQMMYVDVLSRVPSKETTASDHSGPSKTVMMMQPGACFGRRWPRRSSPSPATEATGFFCRHRTPAGAMCSGPNVTTMRAMAVIYPCHGCSVCQSVSQSVSRAPTEQTFKVEAKEQQQQQRQPRRE